MYLVSSVYVDIKWVDYTLLSYYLPLRNIKMDCGITIPTVPTMHYRALP